MRNLNTVDALFVAADGPADPKITFSSISWILPTVDPSEVANYELTKLINEQKTLAIEFVRRLKNLDILWSGFRLIKKEL